MGFIGAFVGLFLNTGISGFLASTRNSEAALKAQFALDRISAELRQIKNWPRTAVGNRYHLSKPGPHWDAQNPLRWDHQNHLLPRGQRSVRRYPLLDQVASFNISYTPADMDQLDNDDEISSILINFTIADVPRTFSLRIYPRTPIPYP